MAQLDLTKAFDKLWKEGLIFKLQQLGLEGPTLAWITDFLEKRKYRVIYPTETEYVH